MCRPMITVMLEQVAKVHMSSIMVDLGDGIWGFQMIVSFDVKCSVMIRFGKWNKICFFIILFNSAISI